MEKYQEIKAKKTRKIKNMFKIKWKKKINKDKIYQ